MKLFVISVLLMLNISAFAKPIEENVIESSWIEIDWTKVIPIVERPGFWEGREIQPMYQPGQDTARIVGGNIVAPHSHPYQAALVIDTTNLCGGSLVTTHTILTAAHCLLNSFGSQVILGAHQLTVDEVSQFRASATFSAYRIHQSFNPNLFTSDVATITLPEIVPLNAQRARITLAPANVGTLDGTLATVTGWGRISDYSSETSEFLRGTQNNIITNVLCTATYGPSVIASTICMATIGGRGTCIGDNGGPLTRQVGGSRQQIGIISFQSNLGVGCQVGNPVGSARISR